MDGRELKVYGMQGASLNLLEDYALVGRGRLRGEYLEAARERLEQEFPLGSTVQLVERSAYDELSDLVNSGELTREDLDRLSPRETFKEIQRYDASRPKEERDEEQFPHLKKRLIEQGLYRFTVPVLDFVVTYTPQSELRREAAPLNELAYKYLAGELDRNPNDFETELVRYQDYQSLFEQAAAELEGRKSGPRLRVVSSPQTPSFPLAAECKRG